MPTVHYLPKDFSPDLNNLKNKTILITGAGDGLGRAAALHYAEQGATVILLGKTEAKLEAVYDEIEKKGYAQPALCPFDLMSTDAAAYKQITQVVEGNFGKLDGLLHSAGLLGPLNPIENYKAEKWLEVMQVNVNAGFMLTQALLPALKQSPQSSIIFTSSGVGRKGRAYWGAYSVSKFAVEGLMETLADELGETSNVRVNCINPGATRTAMRAQAYPAENPQNLPTPEELMPLYLYLMCETSENINGKTFDAQKLN